MFRNKCQGHSRDRAPHFVDLLYVKPAHASVQDALKKEAGWSSQIADTEEGLRAEDFLFVVEWGWWECRGGAGCCW